MHQRSVAQGLQGPTTAKYNTEARYPKVTEQCTKPNVLTWSSYALLAKRKHAQLFKMDIQHNELVNKRKFDPKFHIIFCI